MRRSFDLLAAPYRWLEFVTFGRTLQRCRFRFLPQLRRVQRALLLGDGDGRFTARLLGTAPNATALAADSSNAMLRHLHGRCRAQGFDARVSTCCADLRQALPPAITQQRYDLIATHFFLDCLSDKEVRHLVGQVVPLLTPDAQWVVSEFNVPASALSVVARPLIQVLYLAFRLLTGLEARRLPNYRAAFLDCGLQQQSSAQFLGGILVAELWVVAASTGKGGTGKLERDEPLCHAPRVGGHAP